MINGNIDEFMDKLWSGEELIYTYNEKKYFSQGYIMDDGKYRFELQRWEPDADILWKTEGLSNQDSLEAFLNPDTRNDVRKRYLDELKRKLPHSNIYEIKRLTPHMTPHIM